MECLDTSKEVGRLLSGDASGRFPVPVIQIAASEGIKVMTDPDYPDDRSGHIEVNADGTATIIVNGKHSSTRKRFTIAHEIGHFVFDLDYLREHGYIDRDGDAMDASYRKRESRANSFAAQLLMPEQTFIQQWVALKSVDRVADYFSVSRDAVRFRAMNLGLTVAQ